MSIDRSVSAGMKAFIRSRVRKYIAQNLMFIEGDLPIGDDDSFTENGIVDSAGVLELALYIEFFFGIDVQDAEVLPENFDSVNSVVSYVLAKQQRLGETGTAGDAA